MPSWTRRLLGRASHDPFPSEAWNFKVLGSAIARERYAAGLAGPGAHGPAEPVPVGLAGGLCRQADIESPWLKHWCDRLHMAPIYHRKVWEDCYALQALWEAGMLAPGRRGLGFAVGVESLPSFMAAQGVEVLATDLAASHDAAGVWRSSGQHSDRPEQLFRADLVDRAAFEARVHHRAVDMNRIPADLHGGFDFCWSICAMEHLGTVEHGLAFVQNAMRCLRPGGLAVHTMEFNLHAARSQPLRRGPTVLFEEDDIRRLVQHLSAAGHQVAPICFQQGDGVLDGLIDLPPFDLDAGWPPGTPRAPHLQALYRGRAVTSLGIVIRAG